jgi:DNA-binding CsgD family transcriptional regulator
MMGVKPLSDTQVAILRFAAQDANDKEIAADLGLSIRTVRWHWQHIFRKTGHPTRVGAAVSWARLTGTVSTDSSGRAECEPRSSQ